MSDIDISFPILTPESLGVNPYYVLQYNAVTRSIHNLSATAQKLTAMAMAILPPDMSSRTVQFKFAEFCKALGYEKGGKSYRIFTNAVDECMGNIITIEIPGKTKRSGQWEKFVWFSYAKYDEKTDTCTMTFAQELATVLLKLKKMYTKIHLKDIGKLQSKYSIRLFEIALSYESLKGKDGNKADSWYYQRTIPELRTLFSIPDNIYSTMNDFRKKVIEKPVQEINKAGIGIEFILEYIREGRSLKGVRFKCKRVPKKIESKGKSSKTMVELPDMSSRASYLREEKELMHLQDLYPDEFVQLYEEILADYYNTMPKVFDREFVQQAACAASLLKLKEKYGIVK